MLFLFAKFRLFCLQKFRLFFICKKFWQTFWEQRGKPKIAYYEGVRGLGFFKKKFFVYASYASCMYIVRKTKKLLLWGLKRTASLYGENFFSVWENM